MKVYRFRNEFKAKFNRWLLTDRGKIPEKQSLHHWGGQVNVRYISSWVMLEVHDIREGIQGKNRICC